MLYTDVNSSFLTGKYQKIQKMMKMSILTEKIAISSEKLWEFQWLIIVLKFTKKLSLEDPFLENQQEGGSPKSFKGYIHLL